MSTVRAEAMDADAAKTCSSRLLSVVVGVCLLALAAGPGAVPASGQEEPLPLELVGGAWIPRGPAAATGGQPEIPLSPISGAIEAVVAHPTNPDVVWVGAVNGGIFRTDNATAANPHWTQQTDAQTSLSIAALEIDPTDASHNTLVAGIGRTSSFLSEGGLRSGLLRTTDGGKTWTLLPLPADRRITGVAPRGATIVVSVELSTPFTAGNIGIFRSTNSGATFTQVPGVLAAGVSAYDLAGDPTNNARLFTIVRDRTGGAPANSGIYRSNDTGATWTKVSSAAQNTLINTPLTDGNLAVGTAGPATPNLYAAFCTSGRLATGGLFRTGNASVAVPVWTALDTPGTTELGTFYGIHPGTQCSIHLSLLADRTNSNVVFIGGDRQPANNENGSPGVQFPNSISANQYGGRLFRVDAGLPSGSQATSITNCPPASASLKCGTGRTASGTAPHADSREMVFDANGDLIETDDGGIYRHTDPNGTTGDWVSVIGDLPVTEEHDGAYDTISNILISGNQDNGTTQQSLPQSDIWQGVFGGDGGDVAVAKNDSVAGRSIRYQSAQNFGGVNRREYDAANALISVVFPALTPIGGSPAVSPQFVTPIKVNAINPTWLLVGAANGLYESTTRLDTVYWKFGGGGPVVNGFNGGNPIDYGAADDPAAFYYVTADACVALTTALGAFLTDPSAASTDNAVGVVMDPSTAATAFLADTNQVFMTTNGGSTSGWPEITGNLQSFSPGVLRSIEYVPGTLGISDALVVGADRGVFRAQSPSFSTWDRLGTLPNAPVFELDYDAADDVLVASTLGRGTWMLPRASLQTGNFCNANYTLVQNQWKQISLTCNTNLDVAGTTLGDQFADNLGGTYGTNWVVYRRDATSQSYVQLALTDTLTMGEGYWIKTNLAGQGWNIGGRVNAVLDFPMATSTADPPAGCASSAGRCNMVGNPHLHDVCWADVQVVDGASVLSLSQADPAGACQAASAAANGCVMSRIAHKWTGASYAPFDGVTPGMEGTAVVGDGFWVSAVKSGIKLRVPAVAGPSGLPCGNPRNLDEGGWYVRLIAESGDLRDDTNVLGQLSDGEYGYDAHDLEELAPFGDTFLTVVFPHPSWDGHAGDYASDYHPLRPDSGPDVWRFEVRSSDPAAAVTLSWEGEAAQLPGSLLTDLETGATVAVTGAGSYAFTMNGPSRSFRWANPSAAAGMIFEDSFESGDAGAWSSWIAGDGF